jgi:aminopeptidase N
MEGHQDQEAAEQYYHIHGVYPTWSLAVPAADVGKLVSFLPNQPYPVAATNGAAASASSSSRGSKKDKSHEKSSNDNIRLPRDVLPIRYDVRLFPVLEKGNFSILGHVAIDIQCKMETDRIVLHSADIVVDPKSVKVETAQYIQQHLEDNEGYNWNILFSLPGI